MTLALKPIFHCTYSLACPALGFTTLATRSHHGQGEKGQDFHTTVVMIILWKKYKGSTWGSFEFSHDTRKLDVLDFFN